MLGCPRPPVTGRTRPPRKGPTERQRSASKNFGLIGVDDSGEASIRSVPVKASGARNKHSPRRAFKISFPKMSFSRSQSISQHRGKPVCPLSATEEPSDGFGALFLTSFLYFEEKLHPNHMSHFEDNRDPPRNSLLRAAKRVVIKVGTSTVTGSNGELSLERIEPIVRSIAALEAGRRQVVLVSSGAVGLGRGWLGLHPATLKGNAKNEDCPRL